MFRVIRKTTLDALNADSAALPALQQELDHAKTEAERATDSAIRAENVAEQQLRDLAQAHADRFQAERDRDAARTERDKVEAAARRELDEIRQDVAQLRDAAANTETGQSRRAAIAYDVLRNLVQDAQARGLELGRPFDLVAIVLGFNTPDPQPAATTTA